jgi:hypothetical protein
VVVVEMIVVTEKDYTRKIEVFATNRRLTSAVFCFSSLSDDLDAVFALMNRESLEAISLGRCRFFVYYDGYWCYECFVY